MYRRGTAEHAGHLNRMLGESVNEWQRRARETATLDGEDQWTCTPGSLVEVPANDLLFDRQADPFQLHNIIDKDPRRASELYAQLREFMAELRTL